MAEYLDHNNRDNDEIDLLELLQTVWNNRKTIITWTLIFALIGLFVAVFTPKQYTATTVMVPQISKSKVGGNLSGLAAMAGINLNAGTVESMPPNLYPKIVKSIPFKQEMLKTRINIQGLNEAVTYTDYLDKHQKFNLIGSLKKYTIGLPGLVLKALKGKPVSNDVTDSSNASIIKVSSGDYKKMAILSGQMSIRVNDKEGFITLAVSMPEALPAAQMTARAQTLLQDAITDFKVKKAREQLDFITKRHDEAKKEFLAKQAALANFRDRNRGISTALFAARQERLQADYNLAYGVYAELAKQLEAQKITVKEDTPVFTIIEPVSVPVNKSKPKRGMILAVWLFLGAVTGVGIVLGKAWVKSLKTNEVEN